MTNEITGVLSTAVSSLSNLVTQIEKWPAAVLVVAVLIVFGSVLKSLALFPNRLIPVGVIVAGSLAYAFLGNPGSVSPDQRYPMLFLGFQGSLFGFIAWIIHAAVLKRFGKKVPFLDGRSGDTMQISKDDIDKTP